MRFLMVWSMLLFVPTIYSMQAPFDKSDMRKNELVPYKEPKPIKMQPFDKRLHAHADVIIISAIILYGIHTMWTYSLSYPRYFYCDR